MELEERVGKSISIFESNLKKLSGVRLSEKETKVVELAKMYYSDTASFVKKKDFITAFSAIEYAHGLLDAIIKTRVD